LEKEYVFGNKGEIIVRNQAQKRGSHSDSLNKWHHFEFTTEQSVCSVLKVKAELIGKH